MDEKRQISKHKCSNDSNKQSFKKTSQNETGSCISKVGMKTKNHPTKALLHPSKHNIDSHTTKQPLLPGISNSILSSHPNLIQLSYNRASEIYISMKKEATAAIRADHILEFISNYIFQIYVTILIKKFHNRQFKNSAIVSELLTKNLKKLIIIPPLRLSFQTQSFILGLFLFSKTTPVRFRFDFLKLLCYRLDFDPISLQMLQ